MTTKPTPARCSVASQSHPGQLVLSGRVEESQGCTRTGPGAPYRCGATCDSVKAAVEKDLRRPVVLNRPYALAMISGVHDSFIGYLSQPNEPLRGTGSSVKASSAVRFSAVRNERPRTITLQKPNGLGLGRTTAIRYGDVVQMSSARDGRLLTRFVESEPVPNTVDRYRPVNGPRNVIDIVGAVSDPIDPDFTVVNSRWKIVPEYTATDTRIAPLFVGDRFSLAVEPMSSPGYLAFNRASSRFDLVRASQATVFVWTDSCATSIPEDTAYKTIGTPAQNGSRPPTDSAPAPVTDPLGGSGSSAPPPPPPKHADGRWSDGKIAAVAIGSLLGATALVGVTAATVHAVHNQQIHHKKKELLTAATDALQRRNGPKSRRFSGRSSSIPEDIRRQAEKTLG